jgi:hypothetical protein
MAQKYPLMRPPGSSTGATVSSTAILPAARMTAQPQIDRLRSGGGVAHPERQDRTLDEALGGEHLGLLIERQVPGIFGNQHGGNHRLGRQPALISRSGAGACTTASAQPAYFDGG